MNLSHNDILNQLRQYPWLQQVVTALEQRCLPSISLNTFSLGEKQAETGCSRLGGKPDLPTSLNWPHHDQRYLAFLGQINCSELPRHPQLAQLPSQGMLYFFYDSEQQPWGEPDEAPLWRVLFFDGDLSELTQSSAETPPVGEFEATGVSFSLEQQVKFGHPIVDHLLPPRKDSEYRHVIDKLQYIDDDHSEPTLHRIGGYADEVQHDLMEEGAEWVRNEELKLPHTESLYDHYQFKDLSQEQFIQKLERKLTKAEQQLRKHPEWIQAVNSADYKKMASLEGSIPDLRDMLGKAIKSEINPEQGDINTEEYTPKDPSDDKRATEILRKIDKLHRKLSNFTKESGDHSEMLKEVDYLNRQYESTIKEISDELDKNLEQEIEHHQKNQSTYEINKYQRLKDKWTLLLQLDSDPLLDWCWGDGGRLYFWIHQDDLAARRFDKVYLQFQCG